MTRKTPYNTGFASGGVTCKLGTLCFYSSSVQVDSFVLRNPPECKARKRSDAIGRGNAVRQFWANFGVGKACLGSAEVSGYYNDIPTQ